MTEPFHVPKHDEEKLVIRAGADQYLDSDVSIVLRERSIEQLQLVADILEKNLILAHYEARIAAIFDVSNR